MDPNEQMMADQAAQQPPPQADGTEPSTSPAGAMGSGIQQASPEEQEMFDRFVTRGMEMIYDDRMFPKVVDMLDGGAGEEDEEGDPDTGLAMTAEMVVSKVQDMAEQAGQKLPGDVLFHAGLDIIEELAEVSRRAKIKDYSQDPDALERATFKALDLYREKAQKSGKLDQGVAKQDLDTLMQMDSNGQLNKTMRDLASSDESGQAGGEVPEPKRGMEAAARGA